MSIPISSVKMSTRLYNILQNANINCLYDLSRITEREFLRFKNAGRTGLNEAKEILEQNGLSFAMGKKGVVKLPPSSILSELSTRELFAAMAMQGLASTMTIYRAECSLLVAEQAVSYADALLAELEK